MKCATVYDQHNDHNQARLCYHPYSISLPVNFIGEIQFAVAKIQKPGGITLGVNGLNCSKVIDGPGPS